MKIEDISKNTEQLVTIESNDLIPLPYPYDDPANEPLMKRLTDDQRMRYEASLDGIIAIGIPKPSNKEEEEDFVKKFLSGLEKLLTPENNWTFLQPLYHSLEYCVKCQICNDSCPAYLASGKKEIYRPTYRAEVLRRIINKYIKKGINSS